MGWAGLGLSCLDPGLDWSLHLPWSLAALCLGLSWAGLGWAWAWLS